MDAPRRIASARAARVSDIRPLRRLFALIPIDVHRTETTAVLCLSSCSPLAFRRDRFHRCALHKRRRVTHEPTHRAASSRPVRARHRPERRRDDAHLRLPRRRRRDHRAGRLSRRRQPLPARGMDYLDAVSLVRHNSWAKFEAWRAAAGRRLALLTTKGETRLWDFAFRPGDILLVGRESAGAPEFGGRVGGRAPANSHPAAVAVAQRRGRRDDRIGRSPSPDRPPATVKAE